MALDSLPCVISKAHAKMILRSHYGSTNHLTQAFLLIIYMVRIVQIQVADNLLNALSQLTTKSRFDGTNIVKRRLTSQEHAYYLRFIKD